MATQPLLDLEQTVLDAWPAVETCDQEGWRLRSSGGPTHRGNSVATFGAHGSTTLEARIDRAEAWYRERERPAMFQLGPCAAPAGLDAALEARGYARTGEAVFSSALASVVVARSAVDASTLSARVEPEPGDVWLELTARASRFASTHDVLLGFLQRLGSRCRYVTVFAGHEPAAVCMGIRSERRMGVYAMLTLPLHRRRGAARRALQALAQSGLEAGIPQLYLLVERENAAARALYSRCGFGDVYGYHYRVQG
jgi:ribosomal protein S18 acetylase RimI-like enzyme